VQSNPGVATAATSVDADRNGDDPEAEFLRLWNDDVYRGAAERREKEQQRKKK
jgi:hypothetical protein